MSEYQLYQFQAVDQPLSAEQKQRLRDLSSRADVGSYHAYYEYSYSDLPADPVEVLLDGFDLMLYQANWGTTRLLIRLPKELADIRLLQAFAVEDLITIEALADSVLVNIYFNDEEGYVDWLENDGQAAMLTDIPAMLLAGDMRPLYLAWFKAAEWELKYDGCGGDFTNKSLPVPAGFEQQSPCLTQLVETLELDEDLLATLAQFSQPLPQDKPELPLDSLSHQECISWLERVLANEKQLPEKLTRRLSQPATATKEQAPVAVEEILSGVERTKQQRLQKQAELERQARLKYLHSIVNRQQENWQDIIHYIEQKHAHAYDRAVTLLVDLADVAKLEQKEAAFSEKISGLKQKYSNRKALLQRMSRVGL